MNSGVIYYQTGTSCAVRLLVSLYSLRKHYSGPVTILSEGDTAHPFSSKIAECLNADWKEWRCGVPSGKNWIYLVKTRYHIGTPYELTVALDCDTLVLHPINELFGLAAESEFCVPRFADWRSDGSRISKRIKAWTPWLPDDIKPALSFGPAINIGVFAFHKNSELCRDWLPIALPGRKNFIPDESSCQVILHRYPHRVIDQAWNQSCKYNVSSKSAPRIIHYHGRKHCRPSLPYSGDQWVNAWREVEQLNLAEISTWQPGGDRMLRRFMRQEGSEPLSSI